MSAAPQTSASSSPTSSSKAVIGWHILSGLVGALFLFAGGMKLTAPAEMVANFVQWGFPSWFIYVTGAIEVVGAALLITPRLRAFGAALLATTMVGAVGTHAQHAHPFGEWIPSIVLLSLTALITWKERAKLRSLIGR
jgi:putative oxidoreductase